MLATAVATAIPLLALYAIYRLDRYGTRAFRLVALCTAWGIVATRVALAVNTAVLDSGLVAGPTITRVVAPAVEEVAKGLIIAYLVLRPRFTYFVDGAIYGFAVGIGFAVAENYHYLWNHQATALTLATGRVVSTNLMHASTTALTGIGMALARFAPSARRQLGIGLAGLGLAMLLHVAFNTLVTRFSGSTAALYALAAAYGLAGALGVAGSIRLGLRQARGWIRPALAASRRVAAGEIAAVESLDDDVASPLLTAVEARFGERMADDVRDLLRLQARLGILLQTRAQLPDGTARREVDEELARLHGLMDARRRAIGVFCMLHVRAIAPDVAGPIWQSLSAVPSGTAGADSASREAAAAGIDVWTLLGERTAPRRRLAPWRKRGATATRPRAATGRGLSPVARRRLAMLLYVGLTAALWIGPRAVAVPAWATVSEPALARIAAQWLLTLGMLAVLAPPRSVPRRGPARRDLWQRASRRLDARARRGGIRRRLASKAGRLAALVALAGASALVWTSAAWWPSAGWTSHPARMAVQALAQVALVIVAAVAQRHIRVLPGLVTMVAVGAAMVEVLGR